MFTIARRRSWPAVVLAAMAVASPVAAQSGQASSDQPSRYQLEGGRAGSPGAHVVLYGASAADQELADRVFVRLAERAWAGADFQIRADQGVVAIGGTVPSEAARHRVLRTARRTPGVLDVRDHLRIDPAASPPAPANQLIGDAELAQRVALGIAAALPGAKAGPDWWFTGWRVEGPGNQWSLVVHADQGRVLLDGDAPRTSIVRRAVESALRVPGVRSVESDLEVDRRYQTQMDQAPVYGPPYFGGESRGLHRPGPVASPTPLDPLPGTPRPNQPPAALGREAVGIETTMVGEVVDVNRETGRVTVRTSTGTIDFLFPLLGLDNVKPGDKVPVLMRFRERVSISPAG
jgi:osmotically-inducible protein OsmY